LQKSTLVLLACALISGNLAALGRTADGAGGISASVFDVYPGGSIQEAINLAQSGDTIFVHAGTYYENIVVNKVVSLIGENSSTTTVYSPVIGGPGVSKVAIEIVADGAVIQGFTVRFPQGGNNNWGIHAGSISNVTIAENIVVGCTNGIYLVNFSENNVIRGNIIVNSSSVGLYLDTSGGNEIYENTVENNAWYGVNIQGSLQTRGNKFYHNNFVRNKVLQVLVWDPNNVVSDLWDDGYPSGGNYWSDGSHSDAQGDGLADTPRGIPADNPDRYPLMSPFSYWKNPVVGDLNRDMRVDIKDLMIPAASYGSYPGDSNWNSFADVNKDSKVDVRDIALIAARYGQTYP